MGGKRIYQAIFEIGARLAGSFRSAFAAAQARLRGLQAAASRARSIFGKLIGAIGGLGVAFAAFSAGAILKKIFGDAVTEAIEAEQRTRALRNALLLNDKIRKGGTKMADEQLALIYKHNQKLEEAGVLHKDILDNMAIQLAMKGGLPPGQIQDSIDVMQNLLVATKGVTASEEDGTAMAKAWAAAVSRGRLMGLANQGVYITKEQTKAFGKLKTVAARQLWLMEHLGKQYRGVNAAARKTDVGRMILFRNAVKSLSQEVGDELIPAIADMSDAWRAIIEDPQIRGMLINAVKTLAKGVSDVSNIIKDDLLPMLAQLSESEAFKNLVKQAKSLYHWTKGWLDLMGLATKMGAPHDVTIEQRRKAFAGLPGPYMPDVTAQEKILAPIQAITGLELFKPGVVDTAQQFNVVASGIPSSLAPSTQAMNDMKDMGRDMSIVLQTIPPGMIDTAESATKVADGIAAVDDWFTRFDRTLGEFLASIPGIGQFLAPGVVPKPPPAQEKPGFVPTFQHGGVVHRPTMALVGEAGPEAIVPLNRRGVPDSAMDLDQLMKLKPALRDAMTVNVPRYPTQVITPDVTFAPNITINGPATEENQRALDARLRDLARDFVAHFIRAQSHERRLSYEGGY